MWAPSHLDMALSLTLVAAFLLGLEHALEPDHVVAVSTIVTQSEGVAKALLTGSLWGFGHTMTLLVAGILAILLKVRFPPVISLLFELSVGLMLVLLGIWALRNVKRMKLHFHVHSHNGKTHAHLHSHKVSETHDHAHLPFSVGVFHGLAGSGTLLLLVMSTMADVTQGFLFMAAFGGGLIVAMSIISSALSLPLALSGKMSGITRSVSATGAALLSIALGIFVVLRVFL